MSDKIEKCESGKVIREYGPPCFLGPDGKPQCTYEVTEVECGLNLKGIPENEQTRQFFEAARMTDLSTILSVADAMKFAKKKIGPIFDRDHFRPAAETYEKMSQDNFRQEGYRFYENAKRLIQKMKGEEAGIKKEAVQSPEISCQGATFGKNIGIDQKCFGMTLFDSCGGRRCSDYKY